MKASIAQYVFHEITASIEDYKVANSQIGGYFTSKRKSNQAKDKNQNLLDSLFSSNCWYTLKFFHKHFHE